MLQLTSSLLLLVAVTISPIVADYVIDVKLIKFENYNRILANGRTCSSFRNQQCQTTLHICARPGDSSTLCSYGDTKTGVIGDNVIDLNKTFIGSIHNPITYQIRQPFQKFVVSFTAKSNNELIAEYVYQSGSRLPQRSVGEARYELITTRGSQNPTTHLTYQIRSYCSQGYYGPNCITRCDIPITEQTRFQCDVNGQKVCKPGFSGPLCNINDDPCRSAPCKNNATCDRIGSTFKCFCHPQYTGKYCNQGIDECRQAPCLNGGTCVDEINGYYCRCPYGYTGPRCSRNDKCRSVTCLNGGRCAITNFAAKCYCQPGFTGTRCEIPSNSCQSAPCQNSGRCQMVNDRITCLCQHGFSGDRCQFPIEFSCYPECQNGGTCNGNTRICHCLQGFGGRDCSKRDPCASRPCYNNGQCLVQNNFNYVCVCNQGWTGKNCQNIIRSCSSNPCLNGGLCCPNGNSFICNCRQGWTGQTCGIRTNPCTPNPCQNNGQCSRLGPYGFICNCLNGWSGTICTERIPNPYCPSRPCLNGGTCIQNANQFRCQCTLNFTGKYCEVPNPQANFNCSEPTGLFPDPQSCRHFYHCDWNIAYRKDCPGNLHFNNVLKVCDWQYRANCHFGK